MPVTRAEIAVLADDLESEAVPVIAAFVAALGLDARTDVAIVAVPDDSGSPVAVAVIYPGAGHDVDADPAEILNTDESDDVE